MQPYQLLWAKTDKETGRVHRLVYHLLDVGQVARLMWQQALPDQVRRQIMGWLNVSEGEAERTLAFLASLHDLGKAAPCFQRKYAPVLPALEQAGLTLPHATLEPAPHGVVSAWALRSLLVEEAGMTRADARALAQALGGHHGAWPTPDQLQAGRLKARDTGAGPWDAARKDLVCTLKTIYQPAVGVRLPAELAEQHAFLAVFSGLVSVADWIGSMAEWFSFVDAVIDPLLYAGDALARALTALQRLGWLGWQPDGSQFDFAGLFPDTPVPNPYQQAAVDAAPGLETPAMVIAEAPTGVGKTELALYLADTWLQTQRGRGLYIAMPTQATSNQMYHRFTRFLLRRYPQDALNVHLVHSAALLGASNAAQPAAIYDEEQGNGGGLRAADWFQPRKRTLLAPFGVGTVDQALMSVLQTRHFFVRMFGLSHKVVIFDEVHAYDTYMSALFQRVLAWLRRMGTSVILLSATLPQSTRAEFVSAWTGNREQPLPEGAYPRLTLVSPGKVEVKALPAPQPVDLVLRRLDPEPQAVVSYLAGQLQEGGCAAVICNRVARAQKIYRAIRDAGIVSPDSLKLFHARYPFAWRDEDERKVLDWFGKGKERPQRAVVVATQVIEQSLDLDFDLMVTDLAPVDLLLQRAGRLHRHAQNDPNRPARLRDRRLAVCYPAGSGALPEFGKDEQIYDRSTLLRTWLVIKDRERLRLPEETEALIEAVYDEHLPGDLAAAWAAELRAADAKMQAERRKERYEAAQRMVAPPDDEDLLYGSNLGLEEDNPMLHRTFQALTRLIEPGVSLVCLHQTAHGLAFDPDGSGAPLDLDPRPDSEMTLQLLRRALSLQDRGVVAYYSKDRERRWKETAALRNHSLAIFDANGVCRPAGAPFALKLDRETGLEVLKEA